MARMIGAMAYAPPWVAVPVTSQSDQTVAPTDLGAVQVEPRDNQSLP
ncbi:MAG: hypothetical protein AAGC57_13850 [Pseudomonadota bacterium]